MSLDKIIATSVQGLRGPGLTDDDKALLSAVQGSSSALVPFERSLRDGGAALFTITTTDTAAWSIAAGFGGVGFVADGTDLLASDADAVVSGLRAYLQAGAGATAILLQLYRRDLADADAAPGTATSDQVVATVTTPLASLGLVAGGGMVQVTVDLPVIKPAADASYVAVVSAVDDAKTRHVLGFGQGQPPAGVPGRINGFYRPAPTSNNFGLAFGASAAAAWLAPSYVDVPALKSTVSGQAQALAKVDLSFATALRLAGARQGDGSFWSSGEGHYRWAYGVQCGTGQDIPAGIIVDTAGADLDIGPSVDRITMRAWSRPTNPATVGTAPGAGPHDVELFLITLTLAQLGLTAATPGTLQRCAFPFDRHLTQEGQTLLFQWTATDDAGVTQGFGLARDFGAGAGLTQQQRGFYDGGAPVPGALAWRLGTSVYVPVAAGSDSATDLRDRIDTATASASGWTVTVAGRYSRGGEATPFGGDLVMTAPTMGTVADEARTLTATPIGVAHRYYNAAGVLAHANVSDVTVKDAATGAVLVAGTDYVVEPNGGVVSLPGSTGSARPVKVSYHWSMRRYDLICIDAETRALSVVVGTERATDASEYLPVPATSSQVPLYHARVTAGLGIDLVPLWYLDGQVHRDLLAARDADYARQRHALAPVLAMARRGEMIRVAAMGDSIVGQEDGTGQSPANAPNTPHRDRTNFFAFAIGADRVGQLPLYDQGDGAGQVHTRTSSGWAVCNALAALGGNVAYANFGIGGTGSGGGAGNGADPALRAAVWASNPHLVLAHYGMNETGSDATEANLRSIIDDAASRGACVLVIGMPRPSTIKPVTMDAVRKTPRGRVSQPPVGHPRRLLRARVDR